MIQTNQVDVVQQRTQTSDPPTVAGLTKSFPVVKRIAPKLSRHTEIIRRHTGNDTRATIFVQQKQLVVGPYVAGVSGNKKWKVADQSHALFVGVSLHPLGLAEQQELRKGCFADLIGKLTANAAERRGLALHNFRGPVEIMRVAELGFPHPKEREISQPTMMLVAELLMIGLQVRVGGRFEVFPSLC